MSLFPLDVRPPSQDWLLALVYDDAAARATHTGGEGPRGCQRGGGVGGGGVDSKENSEGIRWWWGWWCCRGEGGGVSLLSECLGFKLMRRLSAQR